MHGGWRTASVWIALGAPLLWAGCGGPTAEPRAEAGAAADSAPAASGAPGLKAIMAGLAADMAGAAMGIWTEDGGIVQATSGRIADHPRVPPEQMSAIQAELGAEFADFVAFDQLVHGRSVELGEAAAAGKPTDELLGVFVEVERGCVACHARFRWRVSAALAVPGG